MRCRHRTRGRGVERSLRPLRRWGGLGLVVAGLLLTTTSGCTAARIRAAARKGDDAEVLRVGSVDARGRKYLPRRAAARAYALALEHTGRRDEARALLEYDMRHGGELKSLLALADLELRAGLTGTAVAHYVRLTTLAPSMLKNREDICALMDSRAAALELRGEALAAYSDKLRAALLCDAGRSRSARRFAKELRARQAPQAKAQATALRTTTLDPLFAIEDERSIRAALLAAKRHGPEALLDLALTRGYALGASDVAELLVAEYEGRLGAGVISDAALRALIGGPLSDGVEDLDPAAASGPNAVVSEPSTAPTPDPDAPALDRLVAAVSAVPGPAGSYAQLRVGRLFVATVEWEEALDEDRLAALPMMERGSSNAGGSAGDDPRRARLEAMLRETLAVLAQAGDSDPRALVAMSRALWLGGDASGAQIVLRQAISARRSTTSRPLTPPDAAGSLSLASDADLLAVRDSDDLALLAWYRLLGRMQDSSGKSAAALALEHAILTRAELLDAATARRWREEAVRFELIRGAPSRALALAAGNESTLRPELAAALATALSMQTVLLRVQHGEGRGGGEGTSAANRAEHAAHLRDRQESEQILDPAKFALATEALHAHEAASAGSLGRGDDLCARTTELELLMLARGDAPDALKALDLFESDVAFRCTMGLLGEALDAGAHRPLATALSDRLSYLPELEWQGIAEDAMSIALAARQHDRAHYLLREAASVDVDPRATWLRAAVRAQSVGRPSLFAFALRETMLGTSQGSTLPLRRALLIHGITQGGPLVEIGELMGEAGGAAELDGPQGDREDATDVDPYRRANEPSDVELWMAVQDHLSGVPAPLRAAEFARVLQELASLGSASHRVDAGTVEPGTATPGSIRRSPAANTTDADGRADAQAQRVRRALRAIAEPAQVVWFAESLEFARDGDRTQFDPHADAVASARASSSWDVRGAKDGGDHVARYDARLGALVLGDGPTRARALASLLHAVDQAQRGLLLGWLEGPHRVYDPKLGMALLVPDAWTLTRTKLGLSLEPWARLGAPPMLSGSPPQVAGLIGDAGIARDVEAQRSVP